MKSSYIYERGLDLIEVLFTLKPLTLKLVLRGGRLRDELKLECLRRRLNRRMQG